MSRMSKPITHEMVVYELERLGWNVPDGDIKQIDWRGPGPRPDVSILTYYVPALPARP